MHEYDKSSKWLIQHHGDSILRLAGVRDIRTWKPLQAEVLASLRYNDPQLLALLGGKEMMIEFPAIQELVAEARQEDILQVLAGRFGQVPQDISAAVHTIQNKPQLDDLIRAAAVCPDLQAFRLRLTA